LSVVSILMKKPCEYALSLKQPWATLLVYGLKTMEVRRWPTARRGRVLIHAASVPDEREEAKALANLLLLTEPQRETAGRLGGIVGAGELIECVRYETAAVFAADEKVHRNDPSWFAKPVLYGFRFTNLEVVPFRAYPGWMRFFPVREDNPRFGRRDEG
jgi:hypothetical protein